MLGVPKITSRTGHEQSCAVLKTLEDWALSSRIQAMCFDTTASNTGRKMGTCTLLQQKLERNVLHVACRHHIMELIFSAAFNATTLRNNRTRRTNLQKISGSMGQDKPRAASVREN